MKLLNCVVVLSFFQVIPSFASFNNESALRVCQQMQDSYQAEEANKCLVTVRDGDFDGKAVEVCKKIVSAFQVAKGNECLATIKNKAYNPVEVNLCSGHVESYQTDKAVECLKIAGSESTQGVVVSTEALNRIEKAVERLNNVTKNNIPREYRDVLLQQINAIALELKEIKGN